jgi:copper chaperone CopZ
MYKLKVENLHCMSCVRNIEETLKNFDASLALQSDVKKQTLTVQTNASIEEVRKLIEEAGYQVKQVEEIE